MPDNYIPIMGLFLAFKDFNFMKGIFKSDWCGLDNFKFLFLTKDAWIMTRNTDRKWSCMILLSYRDRHPISLRSTHPAAPAWPL